eukprot:TRINITY_DN12495_c0_g3_i2.p1 TRINITY_DN12495_c0_g3~~TRINITY_DN12495_c0_g3_i2.p1  ORF type:complete len:531 (+),score=128.92 TRINITY_DN12495_c0_g3_i2:70-1662(+)
MAERRDSSRLMARRKDLKESMAEPRSKAAKRQAGISLDEVSYPPSRDELERYEDIPVERLPQKYKRHTNQRVFCNRSVDMGKIRYLGFDMDYTLCEYNSPATEELTYKLIVDQLIEMGYSEKLRSFKYRPDFPIRGLIVDRSYGNILKTDAYGHILQVYHGHKQLKVKRIREIYPTRFLHSHEIGSRRFRVLNTLFGLPETSLVADIVDFFDTREEYTCVESGLGVQKGSTFLSYEAIYGDIRSAVDRVHDKGHLKSAIVNDMPRYVHRDPKLPVFLARAKENGKGLFLMTNSGYGYTQSIMSYLFDVEGARPWKEYFDLIIVSAKKPSFFNEEGTPLREIDQETGSLKLGEFCGDDPSGRVFSGGSVDHLNHLLGCQGKNILYFGDHIYGDVLKSKKLSGWRTFLIVPEMRHEIESLKKATEHYEHLRNAEFMLAEVYRDLSSEVKTAPDITALKDDLKATADKIDQCFNKHFGSIFRSGTKQSLFAAQSAQYADLYSATMVNLINYPLFYFFHSEMDVLPHEAHTWRV